MIAQVNASSLSSGGSSFIGLRRISTDPLIAKKPR